MYVVLRMSCGRFLAHLWVLTEKPSKIKCFRGFLVAGVVLLGQRPREYLFGMLYQRKPELALLARFFFIVALLKTSFQHAPIKKPGSLIQAFSSSGGRTFYTS